MSYILDSLKKLEQEKIDQPGQSDIRSLLLKAEHSEKEISELRNNIRILLSVAAGLCVLSAMAGIGYYRYSDITQAKLIEQTIKTQPSEIKEESLAKVEPLPADENPIEKGVVPEREFVIRKAPTGEEVEVIESFETNLQKTNVPLPYESFLNRTEEEIALAEFPKFETKGIIFFEEGDPENYVILQDEKGERLRLKKGDAYKNAVLTEILPRKTNYLFDGNFFEKGMGKPVISDE